MQVRLGEETRQVVVRMSNQVRRIDRGRVIDRDLEGRGRETKLGEENSLGRHQMRGKKRLKQQEQVCSQRCLTIAGATH